MCEKRIITRSEAKKAGLRRYYTGVPCEFGHLAERAVSNYNCVMCKMRKKVGSEGAKRYHRLAFQRISPEKRKELAEKQKAKRHANPEYHAQRAKAWRDNNREKRKAYASKRRALLLNAEGSHTPEDIKWLLNVQDGKCANCQIDVGGSYHVDHFIPLSKGGSNWLHNLQILCPPCNTSKGNKDPLEWAHKHTVA